MLASVLVILIVGEVVPDVFFSSFILIIVFIRCKMAMFVIVIRLIRLRLRKRLYRLLTELLRRRSKT